MKKWLLLAVILITVAAWFWIKAQNYRPEFRRVENLMVQSSGNSATVNADLILFNPGMFKAELISTELSVYSNEVKIAHISQTNLAELNPNEEFKLPVTCRLDLRNLALSQGMSAWIEKALNENRNLAIKLEGYCQVRFNKQSIRLPISHEETIQFK